MIKRKVKICVLDHKCKPSQQGNWIDLKCAIKVELKGGFEYYQLPLGIKTELPKWYKAEVKPRSSTFKHYSILQTNSPGEIEANYCEEWLFPCISVLSGNYISSGERICQMQIKLREDAPWYMKILDLFTKIELKYVDEEEIKGNRKGFGSTGIN